MTASALERLRRLRLALRGGPAVGLLSPRLLRALDVARAAQVDARPGRRVRRRVRGELGRGHSPGKWLALLIATGIGLHNFSEGLAIGQAGAAGEVSLALC